MHTVILTHFQYLEFLWGRFYLWGKSYSHSYHNLFSLYFDYCFNKNKKENNNKIVFWQMCKFQWCSFRAETSSRWHKKETVPQAVLYLPFSWAVNYIAYSICLTQLVLNELNYSE